MISSAAVTVQLGSVTSSCFVIMPFAGTYQLMYDRVIKPAILEAGLLCVRADEVFTTPHVTQEIWKQVRASRIVLAELTGRNPNVLYELGMAHAIGKPAIIITRDESDVPFDLRALRYRYYDTGNPFWGEDLKTALVEMCRMALAQEEHEHVLGGISTTTPLPVLFAPVEKPTALTALDVSGIWKGTAQFVGDITLYQWQIHIAQQNDRLAGNAIIIYEQADQTHIVEQAMSGKVEKDTISLTGTSYTFLKQVAGHVWNLESLTATLNPSSGELIGPIKGNKSGTVTLKRTSEPFAA